MTNAKRDQNNVPTFIGVLDTDGVTPMLLHVDPDTGAVMIDDNTTGTYPGGNTAERDENGVPTAIGVSESDEVTPLKVLINSSNELLIDSN
jgi:hypothetical protein